MALSLGFFMTLGLIDCLDSVFSLMGADFIYLGRAENYGSLHLNSSSDLGIVDICGSYIIWISLDRFTAPKPKPI